MSVDSERQKQQETLAEIYSAHHRIGKRCGFTFGGAEKGQLFAQWIGTPREILDIGCRDGTLTRFYTPGNTITGVDVDREALETCERTLGITTQWLDITAGLPFDDESYDVVVISEVLEHLPWPERVVGEIARVLRPDGLFVGSVPNSFRLKNRVTFLLGKEYEIDPTHLRRFSPTSLISLFKPAFKNIRIVPSFGRLVKLHGPLFANTLLWRCEKR